MLCFSPSRRVTANEALMHPYFADYYSDHPSGASGDADTSGSSGAGNRSMRSDLSSTFSSHDDSGGSMGGAHGLWGARAVAHSHALAIYVRVCWHGKNRRMPVCVCARACPPHDFSAKKR